MLINFYVGHFMTFDAIQNFSMVAAEVSENSINRIENDNILRSSIIYGPNAAGKSNFIKAMQFSKAIILKGYNTEFEINTPNFLHRYKNGSISNEPAYFEYVIEIEKNRYQYGIEITEFGQIHSEWLYILENGSIPQCIYSIQRPYRIENKKHIFGSAKIQHACEVDYFQQIQSGANTSLLQHLSNFGIPGQIYQWFCTRLIICSFENPDITMAVPSYYIKKLKYDLKKLDTGIDDIIKGEFKNEKENNFDTELRYSNKPISDEYSETEQKYYMKKSSKTNRIKKLLKCYPSLHCHSHHNGRLYYGQLDKNDNLCLEELQLVHGTQSNKKYINSANHESEGTSRILTLHAALFGEFECPPDNIHMPPGTIVSGKTIVCDEIECSLHPMVVSELVREFLNDPLSEDSQLIATTHEIGFLSVDYIQKDAIWFIDRIDLNHDESTSLYSLLEFPDIEKRMYRTSYLTGKLGAIPIITLDLKKEETNDH